jgi:hypothetical protein
MLRPLARNEQYGVIALAFVLTVLLLALVDPGGGTSRVKTVSVPGAPSPGPRPGAPATGRALTALQSLRAYWEEINAGQYPVAVGRETPTQQARASVSMLARARPLVRIDRIGPAVRLGRAMSAVRIRFFARNTIGPDRTCRLFSIDGEMIVSMGRWLYNGPVPGAPTIDETRQSGDCPGG